MVSSHPQTSSSPCSPAPNESHQGIASVRFWAGRNPAITSWGNGSSSHGFFQGFFYTHIQTVVVFFGLGKFLNQEKLPVGRLGKIGVEIFLGPLPENLNPIKAAGEWFFRWLQTLVLVGFLGDEASRLGRLRLFDGWEKGVPNES